MQVFESELNFFILKTIRICLSVSAKPISAKHQFFPRKPNSGAHDTPENTLSFTGKNGLLFNRFPQLLTRLLTSSGWLRGNLELEWINS